MDDDATFVLAVGVSCKSEEEAVRAIEAFSRPITGLVLDGIMVTITRLNNV